MTTTYKSAGVDIDTGNKLIDRIKPLARLTRQDKVVSGVGGFSGLFSIAGLDIKNPVLVAATDGIGTKLKLALDCNCLDHLGQDLVAMCVNDLICCGAEPLFFLDYFATGRLDIDQATTVITSIANSLKETSCTLLGGETAEMPGLYKDGDFDAAGFAVGIVDKEKIIDGRQIQIGSKIIGLASSGPHSNGYSLIRKIIADHKLDLHDNQFKQALLKPTTLYVNPVKAILHNFNILGMAHITGGGLIENIPRALPPHCQAVIHKKLITIPKVFDVLQKTADISNDEMYRVFNMGIGFVLIVRPESESKILEKLNSLNCQANTIGTIEKQEEPDKTIELL